MPIYDLTYRGWRGERTRVPAWFPILENTVVLAQRNKFLATLYRFCAVPPILACVFLYIRYQQELFALESGRAPRFRGFDFDLPRYFDFLSGQGVLAMLVAGVVGGQAIAGDRRGNALETLFSRAITRRDYLLGRFLGLFALVLGATLLPGLAIWFCDISFSLDPDRVAKTLAYPARIAAWAVVISAATSLLVLACSAMIRRAWVAVAAYGAFVILGSIFAAATGEAIERRAEAAAQVVRGFGWFDACRAVQAWIFDLSPKEVRLSTAPEAAAVFLVLVGTVSLAILLRRVRPIDVVS